MNSQIFIFIKKPLFSFTSIPRSIYWALFECSKVSSIIIGSLINTFLNSNEIEGK
jgi:hypothetical protein